MLFGVFVKSSCQGYTTIFLQIGNSEAAQKGFSQIHIFSENVSSKFCRCEACFVIESHEHNIVEFGVSIDAPVQIHLGQQGLDVYSDQEPSWFHCQAVTAQILH